MPVAASQSLPGPVTVAPEVAELGVFQPNREAPFHRWVHLTEGFSAKLVTQELAGVSRDTHVYDPFGGTGTTPLVAAELGLRGTWAEVNPYLREAASVKVAAACAAQAERRAVIAELGELLAVGPKRSARTPHPLTRANSVRDFFDQKTADELLGWVRRFDEADGLTARLGRLAVASCAIGASNMIRAVDLRRRTPAEQARKRRDASEVLMERVHLMIDDLRSTPTAEGFAECVSNDARELPTDMPPVDLVVTSPPYLNGTNYCRNTKLELLLLAMIDTEDDLKDLRARSVTAGINNVSKRIRDPASIEAVEAVATQLDECAYDRRIPTMVRAYFSDMHLVLGATRAVANPGARFVLDIGDSRFAGVHVDTPDLLCQIAAQVGWRVEAVEIIRARTARDGNPLCQKLLRLCFP